jgi:hypothetical protein
MAVTNGWGEAAINNTIGFGQGAQNSTTNWGAIQSVSASGETNITGSGGEVPFTNTKSIELDGVDDYVTMGDGTLEFNRTSTFSISCWFKAEQAEVSAIISKSYFTGPLQGYMIWQQAHGANVKVNCRLRKSSSEHVQFQGSDVLTKNQWHHVVMTYDGTGNNTGLKMYINGSEGSGTRTGTMSQDVDWTSHSIPLNLGARMNGNIPFNGIIDEVGIFNAELSASDVTDIYNSGTPASLSSYSSLTNWWRCGDGDTSPTLTDNEGSINGTMTNFSTFSTDVPT